MSFKVSARTILQLGSELISSDAVAVYELVKNAIDARSRNGVEIDVHVCLLHSTYVEVMRELERSDARSLEGLTEFLLSRVEATTEPELLGTFKKQLLRCKTTADLHKTLPYIYTTTNWIEIRDTGDGMSEEDIKTKYLVIGTPDRKKVVDEAAAAFAKHGAQKPPATPYLGEKGVGRLSVMRLGWMLELQSAKEQDSTLNLLEIDWRDFEDLDLELKDVKIAPTTGGAKPDRKWSGTRIKVSGLRDNWSSLRIRDIAVSELGKLSDPFTVGRRRFRIAVFFNGERIEIPRMDREILNAAHATVTAKYRIESGTPTLDVYMKFQGPDRTEDKHLSFENVELAGLTDDPYEELPPYALRAVGPFDYEAYWYNRQKLRGIDSIGNLRAVRELQNRWSGIMLFRDGYRVLPYGEDKDDWLGLDRKALASGGYKLNKAQFIGRVQISRLGNPSLTDQTNREGLKETPEKTVLVELLRYITQYLLKNFMDEVTAAQRHVELDISQAESLMSSLESRANQTIRTLKRRHSESAPELQDMQDIFDQVKDYFDRARALAEQTEDEKLRLIHLAGIGLMLEVVAHELARSTETAMRSIASAQAQNLPDDVASTLRTLRTEMQTMNKRLRVLDPLSVSARQRREIFDLVELVEEIFSGRARQFERHHITTKIGGAKTLLVNGVKGMYVQIIENLTSNSVFWLKQRSKEDRSFSPKIDVVIDQRAFRLTFSDNGPGISNGLKEDVFKPFFSTKDKHRRQGLGLYIARECAKYNEAELFLSDKHTAHATRLNTFVLELSRPNA
jgi:signal transduction histidine kinase